MSIAKNFLYNIIYQVTLLVVPIITMPYVSRVLGSNGVGVYAFTNSIVQWFLLFGILGVSLYGQREIAYVRDNEFERNKVFWNIFLGKLITICISIMLYLFFIFFIGKTYYIIYIIQVIYLISAALDISWFFMGIEDFKKTVTRSMIVKLLSVILLFIFVKTKMDLWKYTVILSCSELFGQMILWISINKYVGRLYLNMSEIKMNIYKSFKIFIPQIAIQVYVILDKTMIGIFSDPSEVGYYDMAQKVIRICLAVVTSLGTVMLPRMSNEFINGDFDKLKQHIIKSFRFATYLATPIMFGLIGVSNKFVPWFFGNEFIKTSYFILAISPVLIFIGWNNVIGIQVMLPMGKEKQFTVAVTAGAILNFIMNLILIPRYYGLGASIDSVLAELLILLIEIYYMKEFLPLKKMFQHTLKYWISSIFMFIIVIIIGKYIKLSHDYYYTVLQIIVGGIVYISAMILFKCEFTMLIINRVKNIGRRLIK